jgi:hypothetical protein
MPYIAPSQNPSSSFSIRAIRVPELLIIVLLQLHFFFNVPKSHED